MSYMYCCYIKIYRGFISYSTTTLFGSVRLDFIGIQCDAPLVLANQYPHFHFQVSRVPTQTGKPGKMGRHFPVREKSGNFEQTGKVREITQNTGKLREFEINII